MAIGPRRIPEKMGRLATRNKEKSQWRPSQREPRGSTATTRGGDSQKLATATAATNSTTTRICRNSEQGSARENPRGFDPIQERG